MTIRRCRAWMGMCAGMTVLAAAGLAAAEEAGRVLPAPLAAWREWALWDDLDDQSPRACDDAARVFPFWPSGLQLEVNAVGARGVLEVSVFRDGWLELPGGAGIWPVAVAVADRRLPVLARGDGRPAVRLAPGRHRLECVYAWQELPQRMPLPSGLGIVALTLEGKAVERPVWDAQGDLWFRRHETAAEVDRDFLAVTMHAMIEDGIPLRWHGEIEMVVSGRSREVELGHVLPEGWIPASLTAPIPVALDAAGRFKAQIRPGKWTIRFLAFRLSHPATIRFAADDSPPVSDLLVGLRAKPDFRLVEIEGLPSVDVTQTTYPADWRGVPVYRWETDAAFRLTERLRGMGTRMPDGLKIERALWLDDDGRAFTFRDRISGAIESAWRLDAAPEQELGSVRAEGEGLLITRNPETGAPGVELRSRTVELVAVGRLPRGRDLPASGWRIPAESIQTTVHLPPGFRLFVQQGADWVQGDWLTAWTLLDLFLLLIFTIAVIRLQGVGVGVVAFLTFGLTYHEPGAARFSWLILLMPLALLRVAVAPPWARRLLVLWKWGMAGILVLQVSPFVARQVQQALYPQLERTERWHAHHASADKATMLMVPEAFEGADVRAVPAEDQSVRQRAPAAPASRYAFKSSGLADGSRYNLMQDAKARIQTGPGIPQWTWRTVRYGWSGPVDPSQRVRMILVPRTVERGLSVVRSLLSIGLFVLLLVNRKNKRVPRLASATGAKMTAMALILFLGAGAGQAEAQFPDGALLNTLRERLQAVPDAFPQAANIAALDVSLTGNRLEMTAEIHVANRCAVPLPGRLPSWSPVRVRVNDDPAPAVVRREGGYVWVVLAAGIHHVRIEGLLPEVAEWELTFRLAPRRISVAAPDWAVSGLGPNGVPEAQVLFVRRETQAPGEASYEHPELSPMVLVRRELELGLVWQCRTTVRRLSPPGRAISLRIAVLPGENVLSANATVTDGFMEVRLGAHDLETSWHGEIPVSPELRLATRPEDTGFEQWRLSASPVWNVTFTGPAPGFERHGTDLNPVWTPWPGESVELHVTRPEAVSGATVTIHSVNHETRLGPRLRAMRLQLAVQASLGEEFVIALPPPAVVTELTLDGENMPVRLDDGRLSLSLRPAMQQIRVGYRMEAPLAFRSVVPRVELPVESANLRLSMHVPENRWLLWARGPMLGPAVRFWGILLVSLLAALVLSRLRGSPLGMAEWLLLAIGLTQVPLPGALAVIGWLFLLAWRGRAGPALKPASLFVLMQLCLAGLTLAALGVLVYAVTRGLLGHPNMFVLGNHSTRTVLQWFQARGGPELPQPAIYSVSIWWYRLFMLLWALWLALALLRWLRWGWAQFSRGGYLRRTGTPA